MAMFFYPRNWFWNWGFWFGCLMWIRAFYEQSGFFIGRFKFLDSTWPELALVIVILLGNAFQRNYCFTGIAFVLPELLSGWTFGWKRPKSNCLSLTILWLISNSIPETLLSGIWWLVYLAESVKRCSSRGCSAQNETLYRFSMREFGVTAIIFFRHSPAFLTGFFARIFRRPVWVFCTLFGPVWSNPILAHILNIHYRNSSLSS